MNKFILNREQVKSFIGELQLKQSFIAHKIGVSEKTVSRWMTGKIRYIKYENLIALAEVLNTDYTKLIEKDEKQKLIDQLLKSELLNKLSPYGDFELVEEIFNALAPEHLKDETKAEVFLILSNTKWRTHHYKDAKVYCHKALEIGEKTDDNSIMFEVCFQLATIDSILGEQTALAYFEKAYALKNYSKESYKIASLCNNYGMYLRELGFLEKGLSLLEEAYYLFKKLNKPYNLCITIQGLMTIYYDLEDYDSCFGYVEEGLLYAKKGNYIQGEYAILLYDLKVRMILEMSVEDRHIEAVKNANFDAYITDIIYKYYLKYDHDYSETYFHEIVKHKGMIPFMKGILYLEKYKHYKTIEDLELSRNILSDIHCQWWVE